MLQICYSVVRFSNATVLNIIKFENKTATEPQPHGTILEYFANFKNVAHSLKSG